MRAAIAPKKRDGCSPFLSSLVVPLLARLENIIRLPLHKLRPQPRPAGHHRQPRRDPVLLRTLPHLRQQQHRQQERAVHIDLHRRLDAIDLGPARHRDPRIFTDRIDAVQLRRRLRRERADGVVVAEVEVPDLRHAGAPRGPLDGLLRGVAFGERAAGEDYFGGVEPDEVAGGFDAEPRVGAGDDEGLAGAVFWDDWEVEVEVFDEPLPRKGHGEFAGSWMG